MEFNNVTLGQISIDGKGNYGIAASAVDYDEILPTYLRITDISDEGYIIPDSLKSVNESNSEKYKLEINDIVFARTGNSTGKSYFYDGEDGEFIYAGFLIKFSLDPNKVNPKYIRFYTLSEEYKGWVKGFSTGSTRGNINAQSYANMQIRLPSREYQDFVVNTLSTLENKIKSNKKIINNLKQLSQTLFKRWFIDFEFPNEEGKPYKSSGGEMVQSELGEIPKEWSIKSLDEIAKFQNGLAMQKFRPENNAASLPVLKIKELNQGNTTVNSERCSLDIKQEVKVFDGDVIFSWSGTLLVKLWTGGNAGLNQHLFKVTSEKYEKWFYYLWTKHYLKVFQARAAEKATTMGHIKRSHLKEAKIYLPPEKILTSATKLIQPLIEKMVILGIENKNLTQLRDTLLPKLLSGEIEIPDELEV